MYMNIREIIVLFKSLPNIVSIRLKSLYRRIACYFNSKHLSLSTAELFFQHISESKLIRYDIIVRLLAIENYYGKNNCGFGLYYRMQEHRTGREWADQSVGIFKRLIKSYENDGYNNSEIILDKDLHLIDGSHRMALALYYNQGNINVAVRSYKYEVLCYDIRWFRINGFSDEECALLEAKFLELKRQMVVPFVCTIWHPARNYFEGITHSLSFFGKIKEIKDLHLNKRDYQFYTRGIYAVDDIEKWKIEKKLEYLTEEKSEAYELRIVTLEIDSPEFRLKKVNNKTLSKKCEIAKQLIRNAYKGKIDNYFYDIILHVGDNFYQNKHVCRLLTIPQIDVKSILDHIHGYNYVIIKIDVPYMPEDFPKNYPLGKDIDIICADQKEYVLILDSVLKDVNRYRDFYNIRVVKKYTNIGKEYRSLLRLELEGHFLVFQFDISCRTGRLNDAFTQEMMTNRFGLNGLFVPLRKYEIILRLDEYHNNMGKQYHLEYVKENINSLDKELADKYLHFSWRQLLY